MNKDVTPQMISPETFPDCWEYIVGKYAAVRKSRLIASFIEPICHFFFLLEAIFLTFGLAYVHVPLAAMSALIQKIPHFTTLWFAFSRNVLHRYTLPDVLPVLAWEILIGLVIAWAVPLLIGLVISLLLRLVYHPRRVPLPTCETEGDMARQLLTLARKSQYHQQRQGINAALICSAIYLLVASAAILWVYISLPQEQQSTILSSLGALFVLAFPMIYFVYAGLDYPVYLLAGLMYRYTPPKAFITDICEFVRSTLPEKEAEQLLSIPVHNFGGLRRLWFLLTVRLQNLPIVLKFRQKPMGFPCPLTEENLDSAWKWANHKHYWIKKKLVVRKITALIVHPYFSLMLMGLVFLGLYDSPNPMLTGFFQQFPSLSTFCADLKPILYQSVVGGLLTGWRLLLLYLIPIGFIFLIALQVLAVYHPRSQALDTQKPVAAQLSQLLTQITSLSKISTTGAAVFSHGLFICIGIIFLIAFFCFFYTEAGIGKICLNTILFLLLGYRILRLPLDLCLWLVTGCYVPPRALQETQSYAAQTTLEEKEEPSCQNPTTRN